MNLRPITPLDIQWCTDNLADVIKLVQLAHEGQKDRGGRPYFEHLTHVASRQTSMVGMVLAYTHDSIEDGKLTVVQLVAAGFPYAIVQRIELLNKRPTQDYEDYVREVAEDAYTRKVKIVDINHNLDLSRLRKWNDNLVPRLKKYFMARQILLEKERAAQELET